MRLTFFDPKKVKASGAGAHEQDQHVFPKVKQCRWWQDPGLLKLNLFLIVPMSSQFVQGYDGSLVNNLQSLNYWQDFFDHPTGSILGLINAMFFVGGMVSTPFYSWISDRFGRKWCLQVGSLLTIAGALMQAFANGRALYIVARFILGFGNSLISVGPVMVAELAYPHHRALCTALSNTSYSFGSIFSAWATFGSLHIDSHWAWRLPSILQIVPSIIQTIGIYFLPESPRWLISRDKSDKALETLIKYHGNGDHTDPVVKMEFDEILDTLTLEREQSKSSWLDMLKGRGNQWRTFILFWCGACYQLSGNGLISYYLHTMLNNVGVTSQVEQTVINATSSMFSFICSVAFSFLPAKYGRRRLILISLVLMWVDFCCLTATTGYFAENPNSSAAAWSAVAFIYLYNLCHNLGFVGAIMIYMTEIMPYGTRAKGLAFFHFVSGAATALNTYVNPVGLAAIDWKYYFVYVGWILVEIAVCYSTFPETKGPSLEEIALIFDGDDAAVATHIREVSKKEEAEHVEIA